MSSSHEILLISMLISIACALLGVFLVLRKLSMVVESITHTVLLGIVLAFFITNDLNSPLLIVGAALVGLFTTWLTEMLVKTRLMSEDSGIGMVFTLLFSIAVILLSKYAGKVHLCEDTVLKGELAFAPFDRLVIAGSDIGPVALYVSAALLLLNLAVILFFFKEFKLSSFDPILASVLGFSPALMHYLLMSLVSVTSVGAFQSIGSILVVAFMIAPPATAYLLSDDLKRMMLISCAVALLNSVLGFYMADALALSISGCMAVMCGLSFALAFILAPQRGLMSTMRRKRRHLAQWSNR